MCSNSSDIFVSRVVLRSHAASDRELLTIFRHITQQYMRPPPRADVAPRSMCGHSLLYSATFQFSGQWMAEVSGLGTCQCVVVCTAAAELLDSCVCCSGIDVVYVWFLITWVWCGGHIGMLLRVLANGRHWKPRDWGIILYASRSMVRLRSGLLDG
jgi:hypothetical protein